MIKFKPEQKSKDATSSMSLPEKLLLLNAYMKQIKTAGMLEKVKIAEQASVLSSAILAEIVLKQGKQAGQIDHLFALVEAGNV
ncbi:MAG: hypothetical protein R8K20_06990 [Gallionellaceae bacterium]